MIIALDYDGTYTADPELWLEFVKQALSKGHKIICVTMRTPQEGMLMDQRLKNLIEVIFTSRKAKKKFLVVERNLRPDIWIDDNPDYLYNDA